MAPSHLNQPQHQFSRSIQQERRKAKQGGVLSYGDDGGSDNNLANFGVISEEKHADINQLKGEIDQIRSIMNQLRVSGDSALSLEPNQPMTADEQRSSLLSNLSRVKQQRIDGTSAPLNAEDRESIASFLRKQQQQQPNLLNTQLIGDDFQPNLQMFESMISILSQNTPGGGLTASINESPS